MTPRQREVRRLRRKGFTFAEIGQQLGITAECAWSHALDPGERERRQKRAKCIDCGKGIRKLGRCATCCGVYKTIWTEDAIIEAMRQWTRRHRCAPRNREWRRAGPGYPSCATVVRKFGTWNAALRAARLPIVFRGIPGRCIECGEPFPCVTPHCDRCRRRAYAHRSTPRNAMAA